jgi:hypothetical protein
LKTGWYGAELATDKSLPDSTRSPARESVGRYLDSQNF